MGYRSDSITVSRGMGPLSLPLRRHLCIPQRTQTQSTCLRRSQSLLMNDQLSGALLQAYLLRMGCSGCVPHPDPACHPDPARHAVESHLTSEITEDVSRHLEVACQFSLSSGESSCVYLRMSFVSQANGG